MMQPLFLASDSGALFCAYYPPATEPPTRAILHVPAFAEEMNKSRQMVALQARAFAARGYAVLVMDLFGTGDSVGDFGDATWTLWLDNIATAIAWLQGRGASTVDLWGLRSGALVAMDFVSRRSAAVDRLIAWQPVLNGDTFVTQFLRLRVAASVMDNNAPKEKTSDLKRQLQDGLAVEVAGYSLNPDLVNPLLSIRSDRLSLIGLKSLTMFEVVASADAQIGMASAQFLAQLQATGINCSLTQAVGDSFWATQEITLAPELIALTTDRVGQ